MVVWDERMFQNDFAVINNNGNASKLTTEKLRPGALFPQFPITYFPLLTRVNKQASVTFPI